MIHLFTEKLLPVIFPAKALDCHATISLLYCGSFHEGFILCKTRNASSLPDIFIEIQHVLQQTTGCILVKILAWKWNGRKYVMENKIAHLEMTKHKPLVMMQTE